MFVQNTDEVLHIQIYLQNCRGKTLLNSSALYDGLLYSHNIAYAPSVYHNRRGDTCVIKPTKTRERGEQLQKANAPGLIWIDPYKRRLSWSGFSTMSGEANEQDRHPASSPQHSSQQQDSKKVPYTLQELENGDTRALFVVPTSMAQDIATTSVSCRGSTFSFSSGEDVLAGTSTLLSSHPPDRRVVCCDFYSPRPKETADAISIRLAQRIQDPLPPSTDEVCAVS